MYLNDIAAKIRSHIPEDRMPDENADKLFLMYAVLVRAKGIDVNESDIHDAWSAWIAEYNPKHESLVAYEKLTPEVRDQDVVFANAARQTAQELGLTDDVELPLFEKVLFPSGPPKDAESISQTTDLYKIMVSSSESLVARRQSVNTFFLTINGALITASGLIVKTSVVDRLSALGIFVLAVAGAILCGAWRSLIVSFGQLNKGKFQVINTIERYLKTAIYAAEWEALGRGEKPEIYRSFTSREVWVPNAFIVLYAVAAIAAIVMMVYGYVDFSSVKKILNHLF